MGCRDRLPTGVSIRPVNGSFVAAVPYLLPSSVKHFKIGIMSHVLNEIPTLGDSLLLCSDGAKRLLTLVGDS